LFVIIKERPPRGLHEEDEIIQAPEEHGTNIEVQVNDFMEEDDHANNTVEDDGTKTLI
jgi:hypothetical protein